MAAQTASGRVAGKVVDGYNAFTLPAAAVEVVGTDKVFHTDLDGRFDAELAPGRHQLKVSFSGYQDQIATVEVAAGQTTPLDVVLSMGTLKLSEAVTVEASAEGTAGSHLAALLERKRSGVISEAMAKDEMSKNADSDAADAMTRLTGVSVVGGEYVYVRGLGERYSNTTLNGAILLSTEPDKKVVPLDLFPTDLVESVKVTKSYLPDRPGEFAGGLLEIEPLSFPPGPTFSISISGGYNSQTTFKDVGRYPGGALDWLGYDDGTRALPDVIPGQKLVERGIFGTGFPRQELQTFGRAFPNVWEPLSGNGRPDSSFSLLAGNRWGRFGAMGSVTYSYEQRARSEQQQYYALGEEGQGLRPTNDFDFRYAVAKANLGGVLNLAYQASANHRLAFENFYTNTGTDETRTFEGYQEDKGVPLRNARLFFLQEELLSSKVSGEHLVASLANSRIDWRVTYSRAKRDEPDLRETLYQFNPAVNDFELANESQSGFRMFNNLDENALQSDGDWSLFFRSFGGRHMMLKLGGSYFFRQRDFTSRRLRFKPTRVRVVDLTQDPQQLLAPEHIGVDFQLEEDTRRTDTYDGEHSVVAGYALADLPLTERLRLVGGARVEFSDQKVVTHDLFDPTLPRVESGLQDADVLPGLNLIYQLGPNTNLRLAASQTVNRPEFRELAPFEFTDVVGGRAVVGYPDLERALIRNADLRWEWFPQGSAEGEVVAVSAFYKGFDQPIERVIEATAAFRTSFRNAESARNLGFEVEARKALGRRLLLGFNYTFVDSTIEISREAGQIQTTLDRPLAGQAQNVLNGMVELRGPRDLTARLLVNWFDDRISDVGALGIPDVIEEGRTSLDVVVIKRLGRYTLRLSGDNLTDTENLFTQGGRVQRLYRTGRSVALDLAYSR